MCELRFEISVKGPSIMSSSYRKEGNNIDPENFKNEGGVSRVEHSSFPLPVHLAPLPWMALKQAPSEPGEERSCLESPGWEPLCHFSPRPLQGLDGSVSSCPSWRRLSSGKPRSALSLRTWDLAREEGTFPPSPAHRNSSELNYPQLSPVLQPQEVLCPVSDGYTIHALEN